MSWWERASTEERLAQIDGGIAVGMSVKQISLNCGAKIYTNGRSEVLYFGHLHGRKFPRVVTSAYRDCGRRSVTLRRRSAGLIEVEDFRAFEIFDRTNSPDRFIDILPGER